MTIDISHSLNWNLYHVEQRHRRQFSGSHVMDWELIGILALFIYATLTLVAVSLLGFSRAEKLLATVSVFGMAGIVALVSFRGTFEIPPIESPADVDAWLRRMDLHLLLLKLLLWTTEAAGGLFLCLATVHVWRQRQELIGKLRSQ